MKKIIIILILIFIIPIKSAYAISFKNTLKFGSGFVCGLLGHEAAHLLGLYINNIKYEQISFDSNYGILTSYKGKPSKTFALAGFTEQIISTEIILAKKAYKNSSFWKGYLTFNIIQPVTNVTANIVNSHHKYNDLNHFSRAGGNKTIVGIVINLHSLYTLYRVMKKSTN